MPENDQDRRPASPAFQRARFEEEVAEEIAAGLKSRKAARRAPKENADRDEET